MPICFLVNELSEIVDFTIIRKEEKPVEEQEPLDKEEKPVEEQQPVDKEEKPTEEQEPLDKEEPKRKGFFRRLFG